MTTGFEALAAINALWEVFVVANDAITLCKKIYDGKPTHDNDLEDFANQMSEVIDNIQEHCQAMSNSEMPSKAETKLAQIANDCQSCIRELQTEVRYVTSIHKKGNFGTAVKSGIRSWSHRKNIERIALKFSNCRDAMDTQMLSQLCSDFDAQTLQHQERFHDVIYSIRSASARNDHSHDKIESYIQAQNDAITAENKRSQLLGSLRAPEMCKRYNDIMGSNEANLDRVFSSYKTIASSQSGPSEHVDANAFRTTTDGHAKVSPETRVVSTQNESNEEIDRVWLSFLAWLKFDGSLFCIRGKPGSGKSTLMKFLIDNEKTKELLQQDNMKPTILSYFFWKMGESSQNTIKGLLCSLVYQVLIGDDETMDFVLDHDVVGSQRDYNDWSVAALRELFGCIAEAKKDRLCIFIDGLDEVCNADGIDKLTELIDEFLKHPNVKICVSSRPEKTVTTWLEGHTAPSIRLEDLTRPEMTSFALKELKPFLVSESMSVEIHRCLSEEVVEKSQGVFLWLYLVLRSLKVGIRNGDSEKMLFDRLHELPSELEQLYADMWQRLNENHSVYRKTAVEYFQFALHGQCTTQFHCETEDFKTLHCTISQPTLGQIVCASRPELQDFLLSGESSVGLTEMQQLCEETELDIENRCADLLQVRPYQRWLSNCPNSTEKLNRFFLERVEFIHRTAHDFLTDTEAGSKIMAHATLAQDEIDESLFRGLLCVCNVLYSKCGMRAYMPGVLDQISQIVERTGSEKSQLIANLLQIVQRLHANGTIGEGPSWKPKSQFLGCLTEFRCFHDYIISTLQHSPSSVTTATVVLRDSLGYDRFLGYIQQLLPSLEIVEALLSACANPHVESIDNKWRTCSDDPLVSNDTTFTHLLKYGVMGIFRSAYAGRNFATFIVKTVLSMAATCPDLEAPTLAILEVCEKGNVEMTRLECWTSTPILSAQYFHVFLEVKLSFLLSYLISNLKHLVNDNDVICEAERMLLRLRPSTPIVRHMMCEDQGPRTFVASRVLSQENCHELVDYLFTRGARQSKNFVGRKKCPSVFEAAWEMTRRLSLEDTSIESMFLSVANDGLGISTFPQAGIVPPDAWLDKMEEDSDYLFPQTLKEMREDKH